MKTLHLIRHAKSSWDNPELADIQRPLAPSGQKASVRMAEALQDSSCFESEIFCSPAVRATQTLDLMDKTVGLCLSRTMDQRLYTFSADDLLKWLLQMNPSLNAVTIIGHNPALLDLCNFLSGIPITKLPTCGYIHLTLEVNEWNRAVRGCATLEELLFPKALGR